MYVATAHIYPSSIPHSQTYPFQTRLLPRSCNQYIFRHFLLASIFHVPCRCSYKIPHNSLIHPCICHMVCCIPNHSYNIPCKDCSLHPIQSCAFLHTCAYPVSFISPMFRDTLNVTFPLSVSQYNELVVSSSIVSTSNISVG